MRRIIALALLLAACTTDDPELGRTDSEATAVLLGGKYYYQTDHFSEACSAGSLSVLTGVNSSGSVYTPVPRNDVTYLKPITFYDGAFGWLCGSVAVNGYDRSECNDAPADWVRFYWSPNSGNIDVKCFKKCGDGSSPSDCTPY